jgi:hypothetical protein
MEPKVDQSSVEQVVANLDAIRSRTAGIDEEKLETLLSLIEDPDSRVIPIIGQELVLVPPGLLTRPLPPVAEASSPPESTLSHLLAQRLAADLRLATEKIRPDAALNDVIAAYRPFMSDRTLVYKKLNILMRSPDIAGLAVPAPLRQLAAIRDFKLFVSTTWDPFLEQALNEVLYGGEKGTIVRSFSTYKPADLEDADLQTNDESPPVIFQMFGAMSEDPYFAATDADMIEFLHRLQHDMRPDRLFAELKDSHLLILGTNFPNWMARLFLRMIKNEKLWVNREKNEYLADSQLAFDGHLVSFLRQYSLNTECFPKITATAFVERLHAEWIARNPERAIRGTRPAPGARVVRAEECVFISYASEDRDQVVKIKDALLAMGWPVWFDRKDLGSGDLYEKTIERTIKSAQACVIVLSPTTGIAEPRFYRKEWGFALERQRDFVGLSRRFIHPVRLSADTAVPDELRHLNALPAFGGEPAPAFLNDLKAILRQVNGGREKR